MRPGISLLAALLLSGLPMVLSHADELPVEEAAAADSALPRAEEEPATEPGLPGAAVRPIPPLEERVVVTATRTEQPLEKTISFTSVVSARELADSPSFVLDDTLRRVPGFSLFRRASSLAAHPTTQGVSLRGIGPSGAGRTLVLFDGVPLNDPFGGWVYWSRVPVAALGGVELVRGATSSLYGSSALGGTIHLLPHAPAPDAFEVSGQYGNRDSYDVGLLASDVSGDRGYLVSGRLFHTDGYYIVGDENRGAVDTPAASEHGALLGRIHLGRFRAGLNVYREERQNGTELQTNSSRLQALDVGYRGEAWDFSLYGQTGRLESSFSRVLPDRSAEFLTAEQNIRSLGGGGSLTWKRDPRLIAGADWRYAAAEGPHQNLAGAFVQGLLEPHARLDLLLGGRFDVWENDRARTSFNPRAGLLFRATESVGIRASAYRGFRAPTLNELHRPFRVGNVSTLANDALDEEHLWGVEAGLELRATARAAVRVNGFLNSLRDPVGNVTLSTSPTLIVRQRQNIGRVRIRGAELDARLRIRGRLEAQCGYLLSDSEVEETGLRLPQAPLHQGSLGIVWRGPVTLGALARWAGDAYEDDLNTFELNGYGVLDLHAGRALSERLSVYISAENVFDRAYPVGRTPVETLGAPRLIHGGVRIRI